MLLQDIPSAGLFKYSWLNGRYKCVQFNLITIIMSITWLVMVMHLSFVSSSRQCKRGKWSFEYQVLGFLIVCPPQLVVICQLCVFVCAYFFFFFSFFIHCCCMKQHRYHSVHLSITREHSCNHLQTVYFIHLLVLSLSLFHLLCMTLRNG